MPIAHSLSLLILDVLLSPGKLSVSSPPWHFVFPNRTGIRYIHTCPPPALFILSQTGGLQPFEWMARTTLAKSIQDLGLSVRIPERSREFEELLGAWSDLIPRNGTAEALAQLAPHFMLAPLSNGDRDTLITATRIFSPKAKMSFVFSSDFPVGVFKPLAGIYVQVEETAGLERDEILHVAGSSFDAKGAREYGLYSVLSYGDPEKEGAQPCFVIKDIKELLPILGLGEEKEEVEGQVEAEEEAEVEVEQNM